MNTTIVAAAAASRHPRSEASSPGSVRSSRNVRIAPSPLHTPAHSPASTPFDAGAMDYFTPQRENSAVPARLRPTLDRVSSTASAIHMVMPGESAERVSEVRAELGQAVRDARGKGSAPAGKEGGLHALAELFRRTRSKGQSKLGSLARVLAGPKVGGFNKRQMQTILTALDRPMTDATAPRIGSTEPLLANTAGMLAQPSVKPLFPFCEALMQEVTRLCDVLYVSDSDADTVLKLRRSAYALCFAIDALDSYEGYPLTPGHKQIVSYQAQLRDHDKRAQVRIRELDAKERTHR